MAVKAFHDENDLGFLNRFFTRYPMNLRNIQDYRFREGKGISDDILDLKYANIEPNSRHFVTPEYVVVSNVNGIKIYRKSEEQKEREDEKEKPQLNQKLSEKFTGIYQKIKDNLQSKGYNINDFKIEKMIFENLGETL